MSDTMALERRFEACRRWLQILDGLIADVTMLSCETLLHRETQKRSLAQQGDALDEIAHQLQCFEEMFEELKTPLGYSLSGTWRDISHLLNEAVALDKAESFDAVLEHLERLRAFWYALGTGQLQAEPSNKDTVTEPSEVQPRHAHVSDLDAAA